MGEKRKITIGILADVDAGKTTLSESMLYISGTLRKKGRVDSGDAFLDTHEIEKSRGITIFSKQAVFEYEDTKFYLVDTPGHTDFAAETERALSVLDCAILLVSASDGVAAHTETLWRLLRKHGIPTFIFVNKTDLDGYDKNKVSDNIHKRLSENIIDFTDYYSRTDEITESAAMCDEQLLELYGENDSLSEKELSMAVGRCNLFPCLFGAALKDEGVEELLNMLCMLTPSPLYGKDLSAQVYKIERDKDGKRMTCMKLTGSCIKVRDVLKYRGANGLNCEEKISRIRIYNGGKFEETELVSAGDICAVLGLTNTYAGQGIGSRTDKTDQTLEPVVSYAVYPPDGCDIFTLLGKLKELQEEDPTLQVTYSQRLEEINVRLMGEMQTAVLCSELKRRFGLDVTIGEGHVLYRETIKNTVEGVGHFEPLRHYAEVHLILEPLPRGSGLVFDSAVSEDRLDRNWQSLIISGLRSKEHIGVLTGSPITDMKITLSAGKAHPKHTEGGDFREAAWRAVRQGLMRAESILLEPYYEFQISVPTEQIGHTMSDMQVIGAEFSAPVTDGDFSVLMGKAPAVRLKSYGTELAAYTKGRGRISVQPCGYFECSDSENVKAESNYIPESDLENTPDSVFCSHGAGYVVSWNEVEQHMHLEPTLTRTSPYRPPEKARSYSISEKELESIMDKIAPKRIIPNEKDKLKSDENKRNNSIKHKPETRPRLLLVDGYNIVFAWQELREIAASNIDSACGRLADILTNYSGYKRLPIMLVFDAYKTPAVTPHMYSSDTIQIIYTRSGQTSDAFIESFCSENRKKLRITVATNDGMVQLSVMSCGGLRMSAHELELDVKATESRIADEIKNYNKKH